MVCIVQDSEEKGKTIFGLSKTFNIFKKNYSNESMENFCVFLVVELFYERNFFDK